MNSKYKIGDVVLGNWTLVKLLGEGAFGSVYEAHREDFGTTYKAAIKVLTIPSNPSEIANARAEGMDEKSIESYFKGMVEDIVQEFALMAKLKGTANVVSYEDHAVIPVKDGIGWDVLIRMELLTPLLDYMSSHEMRRADIIQMGIDVCRALELCQKYNIIHRDIKPENMFVSSLGDYKLGDFGIARTIEKTTGGLSKKGTYTYMAPEVYKEEPYGSNVDIYSLGIVMYRLLNNNRAPFLPNPPAQISYSDRETALMKRIGGKEIPNPQNADGRLAEIVLKACAYNPKDRYDSPVDMRHALEAILYNKAEDAEIYKGYPSIEVNKTAFKSEKNNEEPLEKTAVEDEQEETAIEETAGNKDKLQKGTKTGHKNIIIAILIIVLAVAAVGAGLRLLLNRNTGTTVSNTDKANYMDADESEIQDPNAMCEAGDYLLYSANNYEAAVEWYEKAADAGSADAMAVLGEMYLYGKGVETDEQKGLELLLNAEELGSERVYGILGDYYNDFEDDSICDYEKAEYYYLKAVELGNEWAMNNLGDMYDSGRGVDKDTKKAYELKSEAAKKGNPYALLYMGDCYLDGYNVERNVEKAKEWYTKAAQCTDYTDVVETAKIKLSIIESME